MGSIEPYASAAGKRYRVRYRDLERRQKEKRGFKTKRDAQEYLDTVEVSKRQGTYVDPRDARVPVGSLAPAWLRTKERNTKPSSYVPLEASWRNYVEPRWGNVAIGDVRASDVQEWLDGIHKSPTVIIRAHSVLAGILDRALRDRSIPSNPARGVDLPKKRSRRLHRYLTHDELHTLASNAGQHELLILTMGYCGVRWGEAIELRVRDLDLLRRRLTVARSAVEVGSVIHEGTTKSDKVRWVPIPRTLIEPLARQCAGLDRDDLLFGDKHGLHLRRTRFSDGSKGWFKTALATSGIEPMRVHDLRHTTASLAVASGANVKAVQRMLGHASAAMTLDLYADLFDDDLEALGARMDEAIARAGVGKLWASAAS